MNYQEHFRMCLFVLILCGLLGGVGFSFLFCLGYFVVICLVLCCCFICLFFIWGLGGGIFCIVWVEFCLGFFNIHGVYIPAHFTPLDSVALEIE